MSAERLPNDATGPTVLASLCGSGSCPTVYHHSGRGTMIVQGARVSADELGIDVPDGEFLVEIPEHILLGAAGARRTQAEAGPAS